MNSVDYRYFPKYPAAVYHFISRGLPLLFLLLKGSVFTIRGDSSLSLIVTVV